MRRRDSTYLVELPTLIQPWDSSWTNQLDRVEIRPDDYTKLSYLISLFFFLILIVIKMTTLFRVFAIVKSIFLAFLNWRD